MNNHYRHFSGLVSREISSFNHAWFFHIYMISISALILIGSSLRGRYQPSSWLADTVGRDVPASIFDISPRAVILIGPSLRGRYPPSFWLADTVGRDVPASICITKQSARGCQNTRSIAVFFKSNFPVLVGNRTYTAFAELWLVSEPSVNGCISYTLQYGLVSSAISGWAYLYISI